MKSVLVGGAATVALVTVPHLLLLGGAVIFTGAAVVKALGGSKPAAR